MADEEVQNSEQAAPSRGRMGVILGLIGALGIGAGGGVVMVGPAVAERMSGGGGHAAEVDGGEDGGGHGGGHGEAAAKTAFTVENLVLNPAETKGTRFLMATVVAAMGSESAASALTAREPEVRDRLMELLGSKTVDELADVSRRDALKEEIRIALGQISAPSQIKAVYLPTFVIQ